MYTVGRFTAFWVRVIDLSGGLKRRVQVAKVFMIDKPVVFLDEATTGMDPINKRATLDAIRDHSYFLLMFASSLFYPLDGLPVWLRDVSYANPLTWHTDVLRYTTIGVGATGTVLLEAAAFLAFLAASFAVAVRTLQHGILK